jgi:hypothetical protein
MNSSNLQLSYFGAHDCLLVPDNQGGFDFKFLFTYDCGVEILAEYA